MKKSHFLPLLALLIYLSSCSTKIVIKSSAMNSNPNQILVDKKTNTVISATDDKNGVLINIRIPDSYDQYKVLKYGGYLAINLDANKKIPFIISYPIVNLNNKLRLPIQRVSGSNLPMDSLLVNLSKEAYFMKIYNFYKSPVLKLPINKKDSVGVDVYHEPGAKGALVYTAYIPFNSLQLPSNYKVIDKSKIRISFSSGSLIVRNYNGGGPGFLTSYSLIDPITKAKKNISNRIIRPDQKVLAKLAEPLNFVADLTLASK